ncbi:hypothetical protein BDV18DRAFT_161660 [Aspergillus unguis]
MVYMHYIASRPINSGTNAPHFVWVVISPDRNTADTLFRILQDNKGRSLTVPSVGFNSTTLTPLNIERLSPKLWVLHIRESPGDVGYLGTAICPHISNDVDPAFDPVSGKMFLYAMGNYPDLGAKLLPGTLDFDHDFISGYSFFVRRRGYPNTYWYCCGNLVCLSTTKRSRFIVRIADRNDDDSTKTPLLNHDRVLIEWIDRDGTKPVGIDNEQLSVKASPKPFQFSDFEGRFYLGNEGSLDNPDPARMGTALDLVCWSPDVFQDSFELCYGIPLREL